MDNKEIAKEIIVALISRIPMPAVKFDESGEGQILPKWIGAAYQTIYEAVDAAKHTGDSPKVTHSHRV
jgi:hypothetical protein